MKKVVRLGFNIATTCLTIVLGLGLISSALGIFVGLPIMVYWIFTESTASSEAMGLGIIMMLISGGAWIVLIAFVFKGLYKWAFSE